MIAPMRVALLRRAAAAGVSAMIVFLSDNAGVERGGANIEWVLQARAVRLGFGGDLNHVLMTVVMVSTVEEHLDFVTPEEIVGTHHMDSIQGIDQHVTRFDDGKSGAIQAVQKVGKGDLHRVASLVVGDGEKANEAAELIDVVGGLIRRRDEEVPEFVVGAEVKHRSVLSSGSCLNPCAQTLKRSVGRHDTIVGHEAGCDKS
nr:MAG TPA: hypothetical protein [Caudoviricetes sp.]